MFSFMYRRLSFQKEQDSGFCLRFENVQSLSLLSKADGTFFFYLHSFVFEMLLVL